MTDAPNLKVKDSNTSDSSRGGQLLEWETVKGIVAFTILLAVTAAGLWGFNLSKMDASKASPGMTNCIRMASSAIEITNELPTGQVFLMLANLESELLRAAPAEREKIVRQLANLIVRYDTKNRGDQQVRINRNRMMKLFTQHRYADFSSYFERDDFAGLDLAFMDFSGAEINSLSFEGASLVNASFDGARLRDVSFKRANLRNTDFSSATLSAVDFHQADWFCARGFTLVEVSKLAAGGGISNFPVTLQALESEHDLRYDGKFLDLSDGMRSSIIDDWKKYLRAVPVQSAADRRPLRIVGEVRGVLDYFVPANQLGCSGGWILQNFVGRSQEANCRKR